MCVVEDGKRFYMCQGYRMGLLGKIYMICLFFYLMFN